MVTQHSRRENKSSSAASTFTQPAEMVKDYPVSSMLVIFGVGLGVGVLISQALYEPMARTFYHEPSMMEKLGRQMYDALHSAMPEALARRMPA